MSRDHIDGIVVRRDLACRAQAWCVVGWWGADICPPHRGTFLFFLHTTTQPEPICLSETAATCVQCMRHLVGDLVTKTPNKLREGSQRRYESVSS